MTASERRNGRRYRGRAVEENLTTEFIVEALRARREHALRLPPLEHTIGIGLHQYDPLAVVRDRTPQTWAMSPSELATYSRYLLAAGWATWEIAQLLDLSPVAA